MKLQKSAKYSHFCILLKTTKMLGINSIPVRVTINWLLQMADLSHLQFFIILTNYP